MDWIVLGIVAIIIVLAVRYLYKAKKSGVKCVGCPSGGCCSHNSEKKNKTEEQHSCCSCHESQPSDQSMGH